MVAMDLCLLYEIGWKNKFGALVWAFFFLAKHS